MTIFTSAKYLWIEPTCVLTFRCLSALMTFLYNYFLNSRNVITTHINFRIWSAYEINFMNLSILFWNRRIKWMIIQLNNNVLEYIRKLLTIIPTIYTHNHMSYFILSRPQIVDELTSIWLDNINEHKSIRVIVHNNQKLH